MYTNTTALVDDISKYYDNTDLDTVQVSTVRQNKIMAYVNRVRDELWWWRDWKWTYAEAEVTMSSGSATFPSSFAQIGTFGGLYGQSAGRPWTQINWQEMQTLRKRSIRVNDRLFAVGTSIQIPNTGSSAVFDCIYRKAPTMLNYTDNLDPLPVHFGRALLLGCVARLKEEEGDIRPIWREDFLRAISDAMRVERESESRTFQMPQAVGGKW